MSVTPGVSKTRTISASNGISGGVGSTTVVQGQGIDVSLTGVGSTTSVGSVTPQTDQVISVTGVAGTPAVGSATGQGNISVSITGVAGTSSTGSATGIGNTIINLTGLSTSASVGNVLVWDRIIPAPGNVWSDIAA